MCFIPFTLTKLTLRCYLLEFFRNSGHGALEICPTNKSMNIYRLLVGEMALNYPDPMIYELNPPIPFHVDINIFFFVEVENTTSLCKNGQTQQKWHIYLNDISLEYHNAHSGDVDTNFYVADILVPFFPKLNFSCRR